MCLTICADGGRCVQVADYAWQCTAEGDFVILFLQTARYLLRRVREIKGTQNVSARRNALYSSLVSPHELVSLIFNKGIATH